MISAKRPPVPVIVTTVSAVPDSTSATSTNAEAVAIVAAPANTRLSEVVIASSAVPLPFASVAVTVAPSATAISNYQYEDKLQEKKRQIRLITPEYIDEFVKEFERKMDESK